MYNIHGRYHFLEHIYQAVADDIYEVYTQEDIAIKMTNKKDTNMSFFDRL